MIFPSSFSLVSELSLLLCVLLSLTVSKCFLVFLLFELMFVTCDVMNKCIVKATSYELMQA